MFLLPKGSGDPYRQGEIVDKTGGWRKSIVVETYPYMPIEVSNFTETIPSLIVERGAPCLAAKFKIKGIPGLKCVIVLSLCRNEDAGKTEGLGIEEVIS